MENKVSIQVSCLKFLDSYRFLSSGLDKLVESINSFPLKDPQTLPNIFEYEIFKRNLAYPYEKFTNNNFQEPLNLTKEGFWSTLKQTTPPDEKLTEYKIFLKSLT